MLLLHLCKMSQPYFSVSCNGQHLASFNGYISVRYHCQHSVSYHSHISENDHCQVWAGCYCNMSASWFGQISVSYLLLYFWNSLLSISAYSFCLQIRFADRSSVLAIFMKFFKARGFCIKHFFKTAFSNLATLIEQCLNYLFKEIILDKNSIKNFNVRIC